MTTWRTEELRKIAEADHLHISPSDDGITYSTPIWIKAHGVATNR